MGIKNSIRNIIENIIAQYLLWIVGIAVVILTWLGQLPLYQILLIALGMFGFIFWGMNQYALWKGGHKKGFSSLSDEDMETILGKWLAKRQYSITHKTDEKALFCFVVVDNQKRPINILRPKNDQIVIRLLLALDENDLAKIPPKEQSILRFRIGVEMARFGLLYHASKPMYMYLDLPCDDLLNENIFLAAIDKIRQAHVLVIANLQVVLAITSQANAQGPGKEGSET
ncbi:MAG: hypothetical protein HY529_04615 [Chloroflexi bacterium]|nr:hypothetical protein [Chloroflexota bacterium]